MEKPELSWHSVKLVMAIVLLSTELLSILSCLHRLALTWANVTAFTLFAYITYDYIRTLRNESKMKSWYEENR